MKKLLTCAALALFCSACSTTTYISPDGHKFVRRSFGNKTQFSELVVITGDKEMRVKGYVNDQVELAKESFKAGLEAARKAAIP